MTHTAFQTITLAVALGVAMTVLGRRFQIPAILFYLLSGIIFGPVALGWLHVDQLESTTVVLVEIMVAVILFEGGLSLTTHSFRKTGKAIRRMLLVSIPLTGLGAALLSASVLKLPWPKAFFFGALIVVTGPTVVGSLLKSVPLTPSLRNLLNWESIWGDVLGVLMSAVALEWILPGTGQNPGHVGIALGIRILSGILFGIIGGEILGQWIFPGITALRDPTLPGVVAFAAALLVFHLSNSAVENSGPLAAAVAGFVISIRKTKGLEEIRHFKEQISIVLIGALFVLLSASIDPTKVLHLWLEMTVVALVLGAVVRPAAVLAGLWGSSVPWKERIYAGVIGPRGIVALATVSYAALLLKNDPWMEVISTLTFAIIFLSGAFATLVCRPLAFLLDVATPKSGLGILVVGINKLSSEIARFASAHIPVAFLDTSPAVCSIAERLGHPTVCADVLNSDVYEEALEQGFGRLLAMSTDEALNVLAAQAAAVHLGPAHVYRVRAVPPEDSLLIETAHPPTIAFGEDFFLVQVLEKLKRGEAVLEVIDLTAPHPPNVIPLVVAVKSGTGVHIAHPEEPAEGKALCVKLKNPKEVP